MEDTLTMRSSPRDTSQEPLLAIEATSTTSTTPPATENEDLPTRRSQHDMILANLPPLLSEIDAREPGGGVWNRRSKNTRYRPYIGKWMQEPIDLPYWEMYYGSCRPVSSSEDHISRPRDPLHLEMYGDNTAASEDRSDKETESQHSGTIEDEREEAEDDEAAAEPRCTVCQKEFSDNDLLDDHLVSCHRYPPDQFKCESCPKGFSWKPCLYRHRVSEHGEVRRYPCENCTKVFTDPSNLQRHIRTHHVGARSHACPECGKTFATSSGLKQHTHIHSSVKPFQCEVCFKAYTQFSNLCRHKRMHANCRMQIKCPKCGQSFSTVTSLSKHRRFCDSTTPNGTPTSSALPAGSATIMSHIPHSGPPQSPIILFPPHPPTRFPYPLSPYPPIFHHHPPIPPFGSSVLFPSNVDDPLKRLNFHFPPEPLRPHFGEYEGRKRSHALWNGLPNCSPAKKIKRPFETSPNGLREYNITPPSMSPPNKISPPPADEAFSRPSPARPIHSQRVSYPDPREVIAASNPQSFGESDSTEELTENGNENSPKDLTLNKSIDQADEKHLPPVYDVNIGDKSLKCIENVKKLNGEQPLDLRVDRKRKCETPESSTGKTIFCPPAPETPPKEQEEIKIKHEQGIPEKVAESSPVKTPYSCPKTPLSISEMISPTTNNIPSIAYRPRPIHPVPLPPDMYRTPFLNFPLPSPGNERPIPQAPIIPYGSMRNFSFFSQFNGLNGHVGGRVSFDPRNTPIHAFPGGKPYQNVLPPHIPSSTTSNDVTSGSSGKLKDRYSCKFCGKVFPRSANLTRHLRTHTGEQPYKCKYCERSFSISSNLQRHVRNIHNKEKPFKCPLCDRCFGQQTNLDRHLKKHEADDGSGVVSVADSPDSSNENERDESYFDEIRSFMGKVTPYPSGSYTNDPIVSNYNMHTPVFQSPHVSDLVSIVNKDDEDSDIPSEENSPPNLLDRTSHHDDRLQELQEESPLEMVVNKDLVNSPLSFEVKLKAENTLKNAESTNNNCPEQESIEVVT